MEEAKSKNPTVVVVGAGFAGVAAAAALRAASVEDVIVLEAQDRPGGRVMTKQLEEGYVETGAQFIHGEEGNILFNLASKYNLLMDREIYQTGKISDSSAEDYRDNLFCTSKGEQVDRERATRILHVANEMVHNYANSFYTFNGPNETSVSTFAELIRMTHEKVMACDDGAKEVKEALLRWMYQWEYTDNGARLEELSLPAYGKYTYLPGFGMTLTSSGMEDVFKALLNDTVSAESLLLNKPVQRIHWCSEVYNVSVSVENSPGPHGQSHNSSISSNGSCQPIPKDSILNGASRESAVAAEDHKQAGSQSESKAVKVVCEDGEVIEADHVIVTSSVGYLRKHEASMFVPPLPPKYLTAIRNMGFGVVAKAFLVWDSLDGVLSPDVDGVQFLWLESCPPKVSSSKTQLRTKEGRNWYDNIQGFERVVSHRGALLTWLAGEEAEIMEALPEQEVKDVLYELFIIFTNNPSMPRPKHLVRSQWHSNGYVLGGYSYIADGYDPNTHAVLAQPIPSAKNPLICLAGEATSQRFYSTVHGAIESGQRAARAILRHYGHVTEEEPEPCESAENGLPNSLD